MRAMAVVVVDELEEHHLELATVDDQHPVQAFSANGADEELSEGVCPRSPDRSLDDPDFLGPEDLVEAGCELGVTISDQELDRLRSLGELECEVPGLLDHPGAGRMGRDAGEVHPSGIEFDEEQDVQPSQQHGVDREEVAGQHGRGLRPQELTPGGPSPPR